MEYPSNQILQQMKERAEKKSQDIKENNKELLQLPNWLTDEEKCAYADIVKNLNESITYALSQSDVELIWQYCQLKVLRDRAWKLYNLNPERYVRIVTGICSDGKTPKIAIRENEHYKTLMESNKQLEKIMKDLMLTPEARKNKNGKFTH